MSDNDINDYLIQFLDILKSTNSGLSYIVGEFDMESSNPEINWNIKQLDSSGNVINSNCN